MYCLKLLDQGGAQRDALFIRQEVSVRLRVDPSLWKARTQPRVQLHSVFLDAFCTPLDEQSLRSARAHRVGLHRSRMEMDR